jgi:hypothetical protein
MALVMNGEFLAKCGCTQCSNHIEFPVDAAGAEVQCPHCGQPTVLSLQAPPAAEGERPRRRSWWRPSAGRWRARASRLSTKWASCW